MLNNFLTDLKNLVECESPTDDLVACQKVIETAAKIVENRTKVPPTPTTTLTTQISTITSTTPTTTPTTQTSTFYYRDWETDRKSVV